MTDPTLRPLDPAADLDLVHRWVTEPRARFWGMTEASRNEVREIYSWLQEQDHLAAYLIDLDGVPVGMVQTYDPFVDEIGEYYDRRAGDLGVHLFLADSPARAGVRRLVAEPDTANEPSVARFRSLGFSDGSTVQLPHKVARFLFVDLA